MFLLLIKNLLKKKQFFCSVFPFLNPAPHFQVSQLTGPANAVISPLALIVAS